MTAYGDGEGLAFGSGVPDPPAAQTLNSTIQALLDRTVAAAEAGIRGYKEGEDSVSMLSPQELAIALRQISNPDVIAAVGDISKSETKPMIRFPSW